MKERKEKLKAIIQVFDAQVRGVLEDAELGDLTIRPSEKHSTEKLNELLKWLDDFIKGPVKNFATTYALCPREQWKNYQLLGLTDLAEIILLNNARKELIEAWRKRPTTIRKAHYGGSQS